MTWKDDHSPGGAAFVPGRVDGWCYCGECLSFRSFSMQYEGVDYEQLAWEEQCEAAKVDCGHCGGKGGWPFDELPEEARKQAHNLG